MATRTKTLSLGSIYGYGHKYRGIYKYVETTLESGSETIIDQIDNKTRRKIKHGILSITKVKRSGLINYDTGTYNYVNFLPSYYRMTSPSYVSIPGSPSDGAMTAELLAKTNPSKPLVDVPAFLGEIKDLPIIMRDLSEKFYKAVAQGNLSYQFGIKPIVSDLSYMLDFMEATRKRAEYISNSALGKTRKRILFTGDYSVVGSLTTVESLLNIIRAIPVRRSRELAWGYVIYEPLVNFPETPDELMTLARKAAYGLNFDIASAWELMPWSWLIDWFSNVGDILNAQRNIVPIRPKVIRICRTRLSEETWVNQTWSVPPHIRSVLTKTRSHPVYEFTAEWPAFTANQFSILGSIAALKKR